MSDPPKIDYFDPHLAVKPKPTPFQRFVGCFGFLIYGLLALIFDAALIANLVWRRGGAPNGALAIFALIGGFCTWRAIAALVQFMR